MTLYAFINVHYYIGAHELKRLLCSSVVKNIDISINIDTEISKRYQY